MARFIQKKLLLSLPIFVILVAAVQSHFIDNRVEKSIEIPINQAPYQVSLRSADSGKHFCGGGIISDRWIITAAQCTQGVHSEPDSVYVMVGTANLNKVGQLHSVERIVNHEGFNYAKRQNDIAMIKTEKAFEMKDNAVFPTNFPTYKTDNIIEKGIGLVTVKLSGWGTFHMPNPEDEHETLDTLHAQEAYLLARVSCRRHLGHVNGKLLSDEHLCTRLGAGEGMCIGDIGSPLVTKEGEMVGIASWRGANSCETGYPDVYTRVFPQLNWIWGNMVDATTK